MSADFEFRLVKSGISMCRSINQTELGTISSIRTVDIQG